MWEFLSKLPSIFSFTIILLGIAAIVLIALRGKLRANMGDKAVVIGNEDADDKTPTTSIPKPPPTVITAKRGCGDCILVIMAEREKFELKFRKEKDRVLKTQMVFVEHKLIEIQTLLIKNLMDKVTSSGTSYDFTVQNKLIFGVLRDAFLLVKDEFRRSFKDNGFFEYKGAELTSFIKNQANSISNMIVQHIHNIYPDNDNILDMGEIVKTIAELKSDLEAIITEIYVHAKDTKEDIEARIEEIQKQFGKWVDDFIG